MECSRAQTVKTALICKTAQSFLLVLDILTSDMKIDFNSHAKEANTFDF